MSSPVNSLTASSVSSGSFVILYNALIFLSAVAFLGLLPVYESLGIDSNTASCLFGSYEATIIVSVKSTPAWSVLTPIINTWNSPKLFLVFSSCPTTVASIPLSPPPFLCHLYANTPPAINIISNNTNTTFLNADIFFFGFLFFPFF